MSKKNKNKKNNRFFGKQKSEREVIAEELAEAEAEVTEDAAEETVDETAEETAEKKETLSKEEEALILGNTVEINTKIELARKDPKVVVDLDSDNPTFETSQIEPEKIKAYMAEYTGEIDVDALEAERAKVKQEELDKIKEKQADIAKKNKAKSEEVAKAKENDERRELRHKRRVKNQVVSILVIVIFLAIVIGGGVFVVKFLIDHRATIANDPVVEQPSQDDLINDVLGDEEEIIEPEVTPDQIIDEVDDTVVEEDPIDVYVTSIIESMTLEDKVAGLFITTPESITGVDAATVAGNGTKTALEKYAVGGLVYDSKNIADKDTFKTMISTTLTLVKYPTFIVVNEEGGKVGPIAGAGYYTAVDSAEKLAESKDVTQVYSAGVTVGLALSSLGINVDLAPVADIGAEGNFMGSRLFGSEATLNAEYVKQMAKGLEDGGVTACIKYFPGLGFSATNPKDGRVTTDRTEEEFRNNEFVVYRAAIENGAKMIMISNATITAFDELQPATLSNKVITEILRTELGYEGVILSGNLSDAAIADYYEADEAAVAALKAGCDMLQCPDDFELAYNGIIKAVNDGVISEERINDALLRIYRIKYADLFEAEDGD